MPWKKASQLSRKSYLIILSETVCLLFSSALGASALKAAASSSAKRKDTSADTRGEKKKKSALEEIMEVEGMIYWYVLLMCLCLHWDVIYMLFVQMEEKKKKKQSVRLDFWLQPNIVVKVVTKRLGEKYHKKKAIIMVKNALHLSLWEYVYVHMDQVYYVYLTKRRTSRNNIDLNST